MNIIIINDHGYVAGGAAQAAIAGLNALANTKHNVIFISSVSPISPLIDQNLVRCFNFNEKELLENPSPIKAAIFGLWNFSIANKLKGILKEYSPTDTIIHFHTWSKALSAIAIRTCYDQNFKIVATLHDYFAVCPNGGLFNYQKQISCVLRPMSLSCICTNCDARNFMHKQWRVVRQIIQKNIGKMPCGINTFVSISDFSEKILRPLLPLSTKFYRVRNPISIEKAKLAKPALSNKFSFVGNLCQQKGVRLFASAAKLAGIIPYFVGAGDEEKAVKAINSESVITGWQNRISVTNAIFESRAIVLPSLWYETQGLVVLEAAALGIPSIVSDQCAARDSIIDGFNGLLFKSGDAKDLSEKISYLQKNDDLVNTLGKNAYENYWSNPSTINSHAKDLISLYASILKDPI